MKWNSPITDITPENSILDFDFYSEQNSNSQSSHTSDYSSEAEPAIQFSVVTEKPKQKKSTSARKYRRRHTLPLATKISYRANMDLRELVTISKNKMNLLGSAPQVVNNFSSDIRKAVLISRMLNSIGNAMGNDYIYQDQYYKDGLA